MKVIVGFSHANNLFSKFIEFMTSSKISHCYIRLNDGVVFQASGMYVNENTYESFQAVETVIAELPVEISDEQFAKAEAFRKSVLGKPYSLKEVLGFAWVLFMKRVFNKKVANPLKDGDHAYVCVKLAALYAGINDSQENLTPEDLYEIVTQLQPHQGP